MNPSGSLIRKEAVSGLFYPDNEKAIIDFIKFIEKTYPDLISKIMDAVNGLKINGLIVPHAGWIYSGKTAFLAYKILELIKPRCIALLGPSHKFPINRIFADGHSYWSTPVGLIKEEKDHFFESNTTFHAHEHSLEVQAPFIKYFSDKSTLLPLVIGQIEDAEIERCANHLFDHQYFVIISTDLSHFNSLEIAKEKDSTTIDSIQSLMAQDIDACGINPLKIGFEFSKLCNSKPQLVDYSTSAEITGDKSNVVGYASFWF